MQSKKEIAFLTTIFPIKEQFLYDFFDSLKKQTYNRFDVIVVNDGFEDFEQIKRLYKDKLDIIELKYSNTPAKNREFGINYCIKNNYDIIIFGDSDDYFADNRVEKSIGLLKIHDIVVNDLNLFDENGVFEEKYISNRLKNLSIVDFDFIEDKNIFGLSNTAIRLKDIDAVDVPSELNVVDWFLFSRLMYEGKKAIFANETITYYRQHKDNFVGMNKQSDSIIQKKLDVKKKHYKALLEYFKNDFFEKKIISLENEAKKNNINSYLLWWE